LGRVNERLNTAQTALISLLALPLAGANGDIIRDAAIQRFEYTTEAVWKAAQLYLREFEGLELASPKSVIRASCQVGLLCDDDARLALAMVDDRNLTSHTYNEELAEQIYTRLASYAKLMERWLADITRHIA